MVKRTACGVFCITAARPDQDDAIRVPSRLLAAHDARSYLRVRTKPPMVTGAPSQTSTIPYHTMPYHTKKNPYHTIQYHTIPYHTIPYTIRTSLLTAESFPTARYNNTIRSFASSICLEKSRAKGCEGARREGVIPGRTLSSPMNRTGKARGIPPPPLNYFAISPDWPRRALAI